MREEIIINFLLIVFLIYFLFSLQNNLKMFSSVLSSEEIKKLYQELFKIGLATLFVFSLIFLYYLKEEQNIKEEKTKIMKLLKIFPNSLQLKEKLKKIENNKNSQFLEALLFIIGGALVGVLIIKILNPLYRLISISQNIF